MRLIVRNPVDRQLETPTLPPRLRALLEVDDLWLIAGAVHFAAVDAHHIARVVDDVFAACSIPRACDGVLFHLAHAEVHREDIASGGHQV